jgi:hypothetical protein
MTEIKKPQASNSSAQKELDKAEKQFDSFQKEVESLTLDRMNAAPKEETEQQTKLSQKEIANSKDIYLKPDRSIPSQEKFNEKYRADYEFAKEYVFFTAENNEVIGESIVLWTKGFAGQPAEKWTVPVNTPVWGPRYLAERIAGCTYHRLSMEDNKVIGGDAMGSYTGAIVVDSVKHRLNAYPASQRKSVFMGASGF